LQYSERRLKLIYYKTTNKIVGQDGNELDSSILKFLNFPSFRKFINQSKTEYKIFKNKGSNYLFAPYESSNGLSYFVFERKLNSIENIINKK
jgi:hypothetical protein